MSNDADWVEDVRRWYYGGMAPAADRLDAHAAQNNADGAVGYEAAQPLLQAKHWPDAPSVTTSFGTDGTLPPS